MDRLEPIRRSVLESIDPVGVVRMPPAEAGGRYLARSARAAHPAPPFACSAMDGYAVRHRDAAAPVELRVTGTSYAGGVPGPPLAPGEARRIFTGAPVPPEADAVVQEEWTEENGDRVILRRGVKEGENVRRAGEDVLEGGEALPPGTRIGPRQAALLAAVGCLEVEVRRRPRVALVSTGDELLRGRIPDSNGTALAGMLAACGAEVRRFTVGDERVTLGAELARAAEGSDLLVTIGGVSVGERDLVPGVLSAMGGEIRVHGVPMKPGKPFLFARLAGKPVLGLPGSPSACLVAFEVFGRPAVLRLAGAATVGRPRVWLPLSSGCEGRPGRTRFVWGALEPDGRVRPIGKDSAQVRGPALAGALLRIGEGVGDLAEGERVEAWLLAE